MPSRTIVIVSVERPSTTTCSIRGCASRYLRRRPIRNPAAMDEYRPMARCTTVPLEIAPAVLTARSRCSIPAATSTTNRLPASVSRTPRLRRSNKRIPSSCSSCSMLVLTLDCVTPKAVAACQKFKYSATASVCISEQSGIRTPSLDRPALAPASTSFVALRFRYRMVVGAHVIRKSTRRKFP